MLKRKLVVLLGDAALVVLVAVVIHASFRPVPWPSMVQFGILFPAAFYFAGMYERRLATEIAMLEARLAVALVLALFAFAAIGYLIPDLSTGRGVLAAEFAALAVVMPAWRWLLNRVVGVIFLPSRVAVIGGGFAGETLVKALARSEEHEVVGVYDDDPAKQGRAVGPYTVAGASRELLNSPDGAQPDAVAVAITHRKSEELFEFLIECRRRGWQVTDMIEPYEAVTGRLPVEHLSEGWVAFMSELLPVRKGFNAKLKRLMDVAGSVVLLAVGAVPMALAVPAIWLTSRGPTLFRQRRVGRDGEAFDVLKLRTMHRDAEPDGPVWATPNDGRVTAVGRVLRLTRLDEFPQLFNVLRGEMSLVGPRPERPEFVERLEREIPYYGLRHMVKPGVTGWAQVSYPYGASVADAKVKLEYDLYYIRHMGPIFDLRVLLKTIHVLLFAKGSR